MTQNLTWHDRTEPIPKPIEGATLICHDGDCGDAFISSINETGPIWFKPQFSLKTHQWIDLILKEGETIGRDYKYWTIIPTAEREPVEDKPKTLTWEDVINGVDEIDGSFSVKESSGWILPTCADYTPFNEGDKVKITVTRIND